MLIGNKLSDIPQPKTVFAHNSMPLHKNYVYVYVYMQVNMWLCAGGHTLARSIHI